MQQKSLREVFLEAAEIEDARAREAYLDEACGGDAAFRQRIERLLAADSDAGAAPDAPSAASLRDADMVGARIGSYKLLQEIGAGGCGIVYMADQEEPVRRKVALKIIKLGMDTKQVVARFEAERQALAIMDHPNIARVFDAGATEAGRPYFVMELVRGTKITDYCGDRQLSTSQRLALFIQVCHAVQHAHQKGIIHRDLKPSNVLVTEVDGKPVPKVIDFGIAKAIEGRLADNTLFTAFEQLVGTPSYMSPEQASLVTADIDTRTDVYSLGVMLYQLLTGETPFDTKVLLAAGLDEMRKTIREQVPARPSNRLTTMAPDQVKAVARERGSEPSRFMHVLAGDLDWIVMKCLEKDRARRYQTANGLAMDIQRHLHNEPVDARPPSRLYEFQKTVRRHWMGFAATALIIIALCAGVSLSLWQAGIANSAKNDALVAVTEANERLYESLFAQARASRLSGQPHAARESIEAAAQLNATSEIRDEAIAVLAMSGLGEIRSWSSAPLSYGYPDFSDDLSRCAYATQGTLIVTRTSDWEEIARFDTPAETIGQVILSGDGHYLAALSRHGHVRMFDNQIPAEIFKTPIQETSGGTWIDFSPDGQALSILDEFPRIRIFSVPSGNLLRTVPVELSRTTRFHPDGKQIAVASERQIRIMDWLTGEVSHQRVLPARARGLAWHPGGTGLAIALDNEEILVWDIAQERTQTIPARGSPYTIAFSHSGDMMVSGNYPSQIWSVGPFRQLSSTLEGWGVKFARDDSSMAFFRSTLGVGVRDVIRSSICYTVSELAGKANNGAGLGFSPDERYLGFTTETEFQIWDWRLNRMLDTKPSPRAHTLIFHPSEPALLVTSFDGVHRYPIRYAANGSLNGLDDGEPLANLPRDRFYRSSMTPDGKLLAIANPMVTLVYDMTRQEIVSRLQTRNVTEVKISPDGRQVVTSTYRGDGSIVWDVTTGAEIRQISQEDGHTSFSADGRRLAYSTAGRLDVWETSGWTRRLSKNFSSEVVTGGGNVEFSPDGRFLAVIDMHMPALLLDPETGQEMGRLTLPAPMRTYSSAFSDYASFLALDGPDGIHVWDLDTLRQELLALGLDWGRQPGDRPTSKK